MGPCGPGETSSLWNSVEVVAREGITVMRLGGEFDLLMATAVRPRLQALDGDVEVDCAGLTFMDAAGINLLLEMERQCGANGAKLTVVNPPRCVTRLFSLAQLDGVFDIRSEASDV
jgi:anti-sigma B factor antagonist